MQQMLADLVPQWYSVITSCGHKLARIDNSVKFTHVLQALHELTPTHPA